MLYDTCYIVYSLYANLRSRVHRPITCTVAYEELLGRTNGGFTHNQYVLHVIYRVYSVYRIYSVYSVYGVCSVYIVYSVHWELVDYVIFLNLRKIKE